MYNYLINIIQYYSIEAEFSDNIKDALIASAISTIYLASLTLILTSLISIILTIWLTR